MSLKPLHPMNIEKYTRSVEMGPDYLARKFAKVKREMEAVKREQETVVRQLKKQG